MQQAAATPSNMLDEILARLEKMPPKDQAKIKKAALELRQKMIWVPNPGPQTDAYYSEADELLFGGEAGGGKTGLIIGLSLTSHQRSLVLRRTNKEAESLFEEYTKTIGSTIGMNMQKGWRYDGRIVDIGGCQLEEDKQKRKGIAHDLKAFDELVDFTESQYEFIIAWNRSTDEDQRCRIVATTNPPTRPEGMWVVRRWAPWLDPKHPRPAKEGELRWFTTIEGKDTEVDGPGPHVVDGREVMAKSRTFIRSKLSDNPDLMRTDYGARLDALPEELRKAYREGRFDASLKDAPFQAIPTDWIRAAMARWRSNAPVGVPQCGMGVDASGGGDDPMVIAIRHDGWYAPMIEVAGKEIPIDRAGKFCAGLIVSYRRPPCVVVVDMGGGYGGSIYEQLNENDIDVIAHKGSEKSVRRTKDQLLSFRNKRSEAIWKFREALDPSQPGGSPIALPDDQLLLADLAAPTFKVVGTELQVEPKEDVCKRLQRSTDRGDAVVMAWTAGPTYLTDGTEWEARAREMRRGYPTQTTATMGRQNAKRR
jgi:hypothetical protein